MRLVTLICEKKKQNTKISVYAPSCLHLGPFRQTKTSPEKILIPEMKISLKCYVFVAVSKNMNKKPAKVRLVE